MVMVALFRGLNVGGKNKVKMEALRGMLEGIGCRDVRTYIQSGNAVFEADEGEAALSAKIEQGFMDAFGFDSAVILRSGDELGMIIEKLPFPAEDIAEAERAADGAESLYCYLPGAAVPASKIEELRAAYGGRDRISTSGREIYLLCYQSVRDSKLAASLAKLQTPMTSRNLKTLRKLYYIACGEK